MFNPNKKQKLSADNNIIIQYTTTVNAITQFQKLLLNAEFGSEQYFAFSISILALKDRLKTFPTVPTSDQCKLAKQNNQLSLDDYITLNNILKMSSTNVLSKRSYLNVKFAQFGTEASSQAPKKSGQNKKRPRSPTVFDTSLVSLSAEISTQLVASCF